LPTAPAARRAAKGAPLTFGGYAETWLAERALKPRTRSHYASLLHYQLAPWQDVPLRDITVPAVRRWHASLDPERPTVRAHAYTLLRAILATAVEDEAIPANPCHIRGAGKSTRVHKVEPATLDELEALVAAMPPRYRVMTLLAAWCGLRFGELVELRRSDVNVRGAVLHVRRGVVRVDGQTIIGTPKSVRDVAIPPHLMPVLREHLAQHATFGRNGLLFSAAQDPTAHLSPSAFYRVYYPARSAAGRPDLRWHDLRHTGAVLAASTGATLAELMGRLGHSTPGAALRYQHTAPMKARGQ